MFKVSVKTIPGRTKYLYCITKIFCLDLDLLAHFIIKSISEGNNFKKKKRNRKFPLLKLIELSSFFPFLTNFQGNKKNDLPVGFWICWTAFSLQWKMILFQLSLMAWDFTNDKTCKPQESSFYEVEVVVALPQSLSSSAINLQVVCNPTSASNVTLTFTYVNGDSCRWSYVHACWKTGH